MGEKEKVKKLKKKGNKGLCAIVPVVFFQDVLKSLQIVKCGVGGGGADVAFTFAGVCFHSATCEEQEGSPSIYLV